MPSEDDQPDSQPVDSTSSELCQVHSSQVLQPFCPLRESVDYWNGYENGRSSMFLELQKLKDKQLEYQQEYLSTMELIDSYILKAQLQMRVVNGDFLCDLNKIKSDICEIKSYLFTLREMVNDLIVVEQQICKQIME